MPTVYARIRLVCVYLLLLSPCILLGAMRALQSNHNSPLDWVAASFPARQKYDQFVRTFGPGDAVIVSWPGCYWDDPRLDRLVRAWRSAPAFCDPQGQPWFQRVICGRDTLQQLVRPPAPPQPAPPLPQQPAEAGAATAATVLTALGAGGLRDGLPLPEAVRRLQGTLIGPDRRTTCAVLTLTAAALPHRAELVRLIRRSIQLACDVPEADIHLAGPVVDGLSVDEASQRSLAELSVPSALVMLVICWWSLRSIRGAVLVFGIAVFCQGATLAVLDYSGASLSALLIVLPPLVQVLAVAGGIHLMNYYFEAVQTLPPQAAAVQAFRQGWLPCGLSAATTAMGTASLMVSQLSPIRQFGVYATVGVVLTAAAVLALVPCAMLLLPIAPRRKPGAAEQPDRGHGPGPAQRSLTDRGWNWLQRVLQRHAVSVLSLGCLLMLAAAAGLPAVQTSVRIETLFSSRSRILQDYQWLEQHVGRLVPLEVLIQLDHTCQLSDRQRLLLLSQLDTQLRRLPPIQATTSALTFLPAPPPMQDLPERVRGAVVSRLLHTARPVLLQLGCLAETDAGDVWRLTAHCSATDPLDYGALLQAVDDVVRRTLREQPGTAVRAAGPDSRSPASNGCSVTTTGIMPLVHQIQGQLLTDLFSSLLSALVIITVTMTVLEAGLISGLLAMVSNIFPIVMLFGVMGWLQEPMDIGSVMTASIALGIAVDDTLHFLTFFRRAQSSGMSRIQAVQHSFLHCGNAMVQTSVSCGVGLLVFAFSDFLPTSRFAILLTILLLLALLGDLVLLPAILLSPLGRFFEPDTSAARGLTPLPEAVWPTVSGHSRPDGTAVQNSPFTSPP